jgi:hypothetical protein
VIIFLFAVLLALGAGLAIGLSIARRSSASEHVTFTPPTAQLGAIVPPASPASPSSVPTAAAPPSPGLAGQAAMAASIAETVADSMMTSMGAGPTPAAAGFTANTAQLAPVLTRLRELGAVGVIDPQERAVLEAQAAAAMPGSTIEELVVDGTGYRLRVRHGGASLTAAGTWQGDQLGQSVSVAQTVTHAFDASGAPVDLATIADPQLRSMVEGMLRALDHPPPATAG